MLPRVILHNAVSLDGRIDGFMPDIALFYTLAGRWREDATLAGSDTLLQAPAMDEPEPPPNSNASPDDPPVKPQRGRDKRPLLVVPDSRGRLHNWAQLRQVGFWRDVVALCSKATPKSYRDELRKQRITCIVAGTDRVDLRRALEKLHDRFGVRRVRVDSGGTLNGVLLRAGLVDEVSILVHPHLVGGTSPRSCFRAPDLTTPDGAIPLKLAAVEELDHGIVWLRYKVVRPRPRKPTKPRPRT